MHAFSLRIEERPFQVDAEQSRNAGSEPVADRLDRLLHLRTRIGDQRRQEASRAEAAVRGADGADTFDVRVIVEKHATAAVHLHIDEARREQPFDSSDLNACGNAIDRDDTGNPLALHQHSMAFEHPLAIEDARAGNRKRRHSVSVTFFRCGGASGSRPRARATLSASG